MNENEQLERELRSIHPKEPSAGFERRVEEALGESARLAVRQIPEPERTRSSGHPAVARFKPFSVPSFVLWPPPLLLSCSLPSSLPGPAPEQLRSIPTEMIRSFPHWRSRFLLPWKRKVLLTAFRLTSYPQCPNRGGRNRKHRNISLIFSTKESLSVRGWIPLGVTVIIS